jgi:hypothetical protein
MDYTAQADLCVGLNHKTVGPPATLEEQVRHVMTNLPSGKSQTCTIMVGLKIYSFSEIKEIYQRADFPRQ